MKPVVSGLHVLFPCEVRRCALVTAVSEEVSFSGGKVRLPPLSNSLLPNLQTRSIDRSRAFFCRFFAVELSRSVSFFPFAVAFRSVRHVGEDQSWVDATTHFAALALD